MVSPFISTNSTIENLVQFNEFLTSKGYVPSFRELHPIGINEAIIFAELMSKCKYYAENNQLDEEGYFYCSVNQLLQNTGLTERKQKKAIDRLKEIQLIDIQLKVPVYSKEQRAIRHFRVEDNGSIVKEIVLKVKGGEI